VTTKALATTQRPTLAVVSSPPVRPAAKLPVPGTRVQLRDGSKQFGTVRHYERKRPCVLTMLGLFPVELSSGQWCTCSASDVIELAPGRAVGGDHRDADAI
jgi:hypothetical protein